MYARCVFLCVFLCRYLGLGTSDDGQKCWRAGLCMPGVCLCVFLYRYLWLGTSNDGQKCWRAGLCMPGVCFCMCVFLCRYLGRAYLWRGVRSASIKTISKIINQKGEDSRRFFQSPS